MLSVVAGGFRLAEVTGPHYPRRKAGGCECPEGKVSFGWGMEKVWCLGLGQKDRHTGSEQKAGSVEGIRVGPVAHPV